MGIDLRSAKRLAAAGGVSHAAAAPAAAVVAASVVAAAVSVAAAAALRRSPEATDDADDWSTAGTEGQSARRGGVSGKAEVMSSWGHVCGHVHVHCTE